jgi:predicted glycosyltransferase
MELLMARAAGVVAMGGYNTFCEILSFDKRAILIPRVAPRREQLLRAARAAGLGLVRMLDVEQSADTGQMVAALRELPGQPAPSRMGAGRMLRGLETINRIVAGRLRGRLRPGVSRKAAAG